jgi:putative tricarboxylic transport membrane protein
MSEQQTVKGGRSEYGVALLLAGLGAWALVDGMRLGDTVSRGPVSARTVPLVVGLLLVAMAVFLVIDLVRGGHGEPEGGEDVDLSHGSDWTTIGLLVAAFAFNALLIDTLGWPVTGAVLFFGATFALGARHFVRMAVIAVAMSFGTWYFFFLVLGLKLPLGLLDGIL